MSSESDRLLIQDIRAGGAKCAAAWEELVHRYEGRLRAYVRRRLRDHAASDDVVQETFVGFLNSLAQLALKCTAPGVPDFYQGCEQWNFSLVDPDNRRPVDFARLGEGLRQVRALYADGFPAASDWRELLQPLPDGRIKQLATWRLLALRRAHETLFRAGSYLPLAVEGEAAAHVIAFARAREGEAVLVVAARLAHSLCRGDIAAWSPALFQGTALRGGTEIASLRRFTRWRNWLTGAVVPSWSGDDGELPVAALFGSAGGLPFAVLVGEGEAA